MRTNNKVAQSLYKATDGGTIAAICWLKCRAPWKEPRGRLVAIEDESARGQAAANVALCESWIVKPRRAAHPIKALSSTA
ncbi:hypothetical protein [Caballeronia sp. INDeC2]|uniref:hypothetical protein n=1 Tax=Caballeronia sp. INDeC2 TaxID=2921747 RepID=UPI002027C7DF|nr:hypothetical protein [Caballeronia sp. INDeC2]